MTTSDDLGDDVGVTTHSLPMPTRADFQNRPVWWWIATWFGSGLSPIVPGTAGSFAALPFAYIIHVTLGNVALFIASLVIFTIGCWASSQYIKHNEGNDDPRQVVVDEVAGQWLLLAVLFPTWQSYLVAFVLFRIFDIVKPWPVSLADQKIKGGVGIMFDDMLAALYPILIYLFIMVEAQMLGSQKLLLPLMNFLGGSYVH